jgi:hypothetical protein
MNRARMTALAVVSVLVVSAAMVWARSGRAQGSGLAIRPASSIRAPEGVRVRVQVLNGTKVRGLARRATMLLRDRGFDVVEVGTVASSRDTTLILDLSGHPEWANRLARIMAPARVESRRDSSRYLDIAVVLGTSWRPSSEPFHP